MGLKYQHYIQIVLNHVKDSQCYIMFSSTKSVLQAL